MSDNKKQQRNKDFEEWFISQGYPENDLEHDHIGSYYATRTRYMWEAWDSASCRAEQRVVLSDEQISDLKDAISEIEYKYFGCYEFTEKQHTAVDVLVEVARMVLAAKEQA